MDSRLEKLKRKRNDLDKEIENLKKEKDKKTQEQQRDGGNYCRRQSFFASRKISYLVKMQNALNLILNSKKKKKNI